MRRTPLFFFLFLISSPAFAAGDAKDIPFRTDSGLTKAEYLLSAGKYSAALDVAGEVLIRHPDDADAYAYRGYAFSRLGQTEDAVKNFKKALQLNPTHLGANKYLADIYLQSGDVSRAIEQMQVIRMTCGHTDCEELDELEHEIDQYKRGELPKKDAQKEE